MTLRSGNERQMARHSSRGGEAVCAELRTTSDRTSTIRSAWSRLERRLVFAVVLLLIAGVAPTVAMQGASASTLVMVSGRLASTDGTSWPGVTVHYVNDAGASVSAVTDESGGYEMQVPPGAGRLEIFVPYVGDPNPPAWSTPRGEGLPYGFEDQSPVSIDQDTVLDLSLPRVDRLTVSVVDSTGSPVAYAPVTLTPFSQYCTVALVPGTAQASCSSSDSLYGVRAGPDGTVTVPFIDSRDELGPTTHTLGAVDPANAARTGSTPLGDITTDTTRTITISTLVMVSGRLASTDGTSWPGVTVHYVNDAGASVSAVTDESGGYEMQVPPGAGRLEIFVPYVGDPNPPAWSTPRGEGLPYGFESQSPVSIDQDTVLDLSLPRVDRLTVSVVDSTGSPVPYAPVTLTPFSQYCTVALVPGTAQANCSSSASLYGVRAGPDGTVTVPFIDSRDEQGPTTHTLGAVDPANAARTGSTPLGDITTDTTRTITLPDVPAAPASVSVELVDPTTASVSWTAPPTDGGSALIDYVVTATPDEAAPGPAEVSMSARAKTWTRLAQAQQQPADIGELQATVDPATTTVRLKGLSAGTDYQIQVRAENKVGRSASTSATITAPQAARPDAPTIESATLIDATSATVTWAAPVDDGGSAVTGYLITPSRAGIALPTVTVGHVLTTTIAGLSKGVTYTFVVAATNSVGTGRPSAASTAVTVPTTVPGAPSGTTATTHGLSATVRWTRPADDGGTTITRYEVTGTPGGACSTTSALSCVVTGLAYGTAYTFTVVASNSVGDSTSSPASLPVTSPALAPGRPDPPSATTGIAAVTLHWTAPSSDGGSAITGYLITPSKAGVALPPVRVGHVLTTTIAGLSNGSPYTFTVAATNLVGTGVASVASVVVTPRVPTDLVLSTATATATAGSALTVSGRLTRPDTNVALAGVIVHLQYRPRGSTGSFTTLPMTAVSSSTGVVSFTAYKPAYSVQVRMSVTTAGPYTDSTSSTEDITMLRNITIATSTTSPRQGSTYTVSGSVSPSTGGTVYLQRKSGTKWTTLTSTKLSSRSTYSLALKATAKGIRTYRTVITGDPLFGTSISNSRSVHID